MPRFDADYVPSSAMTVFAHPDDAEFSCGGTLAAWARGGCEVTLVLLTNGNVGSHDSAYTRESLAEVRADEQLAAARVLGVKDVQVVGEHDCELVPNLEVRRELVRLIRQVRPEVLICGDPQAWFFANFYINHPDHRAAAQVALEAVFPCAEMELLWPGLGEAHKVHAVYIAGPMQREASVAVDVSATMDAKIAALRCHASQMGDWDPADMVRSWAAEDAKTARKEAKTARKKAKRQAKYAKTAADAPAPGPRRKAKYVETFRVMVLKQDDASY